MMFSGVRVRMVMSGLALTAPPQNEQSYGQPRAPTMFASILPSAALHRFHDTPNRLASMTCAPFAKLGRCRKKGRSSAWLRLCDPGPARACESREARHLPATRPPKTSYLTVTDSVASGCSVLLHVKVPVVENMRTSSRSPRSSSCRPLRRACTRSSGSRRSCSRCREHCPC